MSEIHHGNVGGRALTGTPFLALEVLRSGRRAVRIGGVALCNDLHWTEITRPSHTRSVIDMLTRAGG
ncbi:hypothetical protein [Burkholderia contaminans]|uniref:hypothetical protein n=1 Tax=Burkholderia contaminans TaxID=488447 RepID=UPI001628AB00|nr:hypothetical protein [Burkholderia contaminans]